MSFVWKRPEGRLRTPEQVMAIIIGLVDGLNPPDKRGACICAGMCIAQESDFWCPWNAAEPESKNYPFDSQSDDGRSVGYCQQQTGPNGELWWGPVSQEMSAEGSIGEFLRRLIKRGYNASNAQSANDSVQAIQRSGVPQGYRAHWDRINTLYDSVIGRGAPPAPPPPAPAPVVSYGMPNGSNSGGYGGGGVKFPDWVYALGNAFGVKPSTYPGHQESDRNEAGYAPNPQRLNRGIDWAAPGAPDEVDRMQRFADYLFSVRGELEQVIWWNPRTNKRIGVAGGKDVTTTPYYDYPGGYDDHRDHVHTRQSHSIPLPGGAPPTPIAPVPQRPEFTERDFLTGGGRSNRTRPPINWLLHTEEGNSNAEQLARYCDGSHDVSYHYTVRDRIVCDIVDTDYASWSVLDANVFTINLCFAGSRAAWSRDEWLRREADIEIAAYLAVQDCHKYGIPTVVIPPPYHEAPGISDHKYVTQQLHIGTHTDVGNNFPWDVFARYVTKYASPTPLPPLPPGEDDWLSMPSNQEKLDRIYDAFFAPQPPENIYREPDVVAGQNLVDSIRSTVSMVYEGTVERMALLGERASQDKVVRVAKGLGPEQRQWAIDRARLIWDKGRAGPAAPAIPVTSTAVQAIPAAAPAVPDRLNAELAAAYTEIGRLRELTARLQEQLQAQAAPVSTEVAVIEPTKTSGDHAKGLIDSVNDWTTHALSLTPPEQHALAAASKILLMKNGTEQ